MFGSSRLSAFIFPFDCSQRINAMVESAGASTRASLLLRIRANPSDQAAWKVFVSRFAPLIHAWCRHWKLQEADAQDVTQTVLLKLARTLPDFIYDPARSFRGWLRTITQNAWSDFIKSKWKGVPAAGCSSVMELLDTVQARDDLFQRMQAGFDAELAEHAMERVRERVEPRTWEAFQLTAMEGVSASEVARRLGIRVGTVYRARSVVQGMLRQTMAAMGEEVTAS
jgi:RNA polymerase sigma factor (sigma-70 family)